jgi:hypothetical protein
MSSYFTVNVFAILKNPVINAIVWFKLLRRHLKARKNLDLQKMNRLITFLSFITKRKKQQQELGRN